MKNKNTSSVLFFGIIALIFIFFSFKKKEIKIQYVQETTTFILVRHAETTGTGSERNLSVDGQGRAIELSRVLNNVPLNAVFSTKYNRTMQTANPITKNKNLIIENYNPSNLDAFVDSSLSSHWGETILVVGHSNTTPSLLNILVGENAFSDLPETEYDNLYIVTVFKKGQAKVTRLKYGE